MKRSILFSLAILLGIAIPLAPAAAQQTQRQKLNNRLAAFRLAVTHIAADKPDRIAELESIVLNTLTSNYSQAAQRNLYEARQLVLTAHGEARGVELGQLITDWIATVKSAYRYQPDATYSLTNSSLESFYTETQQAGLLDAGTDCGCPTGMCCEGRICTIC